MHEFINSLLTKYRELMIDEVNTWNDTYELTNADKVAHRAATQCRNCHRPFGTGQAVKTCHHSWDAKVE